MKVTIENKNLKKDKRTKYNKNKKTPKGTKITKQPTKVMYESAEKANF